MATAATEVFRAVVPSVGLVLKVRASLANKQLEYEKRIKEDDASSDCCVPYKANAERMIFLKRRSLRTAARLTIKNSTNSMLSSDRGM